MGFSKCAECEDRKARDAQLLEKARAINQESENARVIELSEEISALLGGGDKNE